VVYLLSCLPLDPRFAGSNPADHDGFLRVIKIRNTTYFEGEVKLSASCEFLRHVKYPYRYEKSYLVCKIQPFFAAFLMFCHKVSAGYFPTELVDGSVNIGTQMVKH
jgi:hypothetical protein